jgi:hypothetical protein
MSKKKKKSNIKIYTHFLEIKTVPFHYIEPLFCLLFSESPYIIIAKIHENVFKSLLVKILTKNFSIFTVNFMYCYYLLCQYFDIIIVFLMFVATFDKQNVV